MQISHQAEALGFCQELLRQPSPSGHEEGVAASVEREMTMLGYDVVQRDTLGSVVGLIHGALPGPTVLVDAHMDTVPVTTPGAWRYEPHSGVVSEGCIWGRGAVDAKGSLAAAVVAAGTLQRSRLAGTLIVAATVGGADRGTGPGAGSVRPCGGYRGHLRAHRIEAGIGAQGARLPGGHR